MKKAMLILVSAVMPLWALAAPSLNPSNSFALADSLLYTTARIECLASNGECRVGTGSFFVFQSGGTNVGIIPVLITCGHVVESCTVGSVLFTVESVESNKTETSQRIVVPNISSLCFHHPDTNIDLVALPLAPLMERLRADKKRIRMMPIMKGMIPDEEMISDFGPMMPLAMIGYPIGIWDERNNLPIIRRGIAATDPRRDYNGRKEFLIDAACFPGSSGSPVYQYEEGFFMKHNQPMHGRRLSFLGILYAGPEYTKEGKLIVRNIPTALEPRSLTTIPVGLGYIIRYDAVMEFEKALQAIGTR